MARLTSTRLPAYVIGSHRVARGEGERVCVRGWGVGKRGVARRATNGGPALEASTRTVELVELVDACAVDGGGCVVRDEAEAARLARVRVAHDHAVDDLPVEACAEPVMTRRVSDVVIATGGRRRAGAGEQAGWCGANASCPAMVAGDAGSGGVVVINGWWGVWVVDEWGRFR